MFTNFAAKTSFTCYTVDDPVRLIYLEAVGPHENFYRDLKRP